MKILRRLQELQEAGEVSFSYEFFCPDTPDGIEALRPRIDRLASTEPLYVDIAANGSQDDLMVAAYLCKYAKKFSGLAALMHVPCVSLTQDAVRALLEDAKSLGVTNILCERGTASQEPVDEAARGKRPAFKACPGGFEHAADLVAFVRREFGDTFCIGVMGYPCGYGEYPTLAEDVAALRVKQAAGADFVILQHVNEPAPLVAYLAALHEADVQLPVIASVLPVHSYDNFMQVSRFTGVDVPAALQAGLDSLKHDDNAVREFGNRAVVTLCKDLMAQGLHVLHFHTMNLEVVIRNVLQDLSLCGPDSAPRRKLPWRASADETRAGEEVRPIFWANRPASYLERTSAWTDYPSGRWSASDARTAGGRAFTTLSETQLLPPTVGSVEDRRAVWGECPSCDADVWEVFARYVEGRVPRLPWCETALHPETSTITRLLARLNRCGFLTINSQPRVNAAPSNDPTFGWGGPGGFVYQKAYVECFTTARHLAALMEAAAAQPSITYHAVDVHGNAYSNARGKSVQAVTWGVFPDREVVQPTVVDADAFMAWKAEAFALWLSQWANIYDDDSAAHAVVFDIHDSYFLVNVVDNNFIDGDIFTVFEAAIVRLRADAAVDKPMASSTRALTHGAHMLSASRTTPPPSMRHATSPPSFLRTPANLT